MTNGIENRTIVDRLKSRKLWVALASGTVIVFANELGITISEDQLWTAAIVIGSYLGGQGIADAARNYRP